MSSLRRSVIFVAVGFNPRYGSRNKCQAPLGASLSNSQTIDIVYCEYRALSAAGLPRLDKHVYYAQCSRDPFGRLRADTLGNGGEAINLFNSP
jgi:hypothetical protein